MLYKRILSFIALIIVLKGYSQNQPSISNLSGNRNAITTHVPFLLISPDAAQGAMGDVGAATDADVNSAHWNVAKFVFSEKKGAVGFNVTPVLRQISTDVNLNYLSGYYRIKPTQVVALSLRYFSLGKIIFKEFNPTGNSVDILNTINPYELALDVSFAQKLTDNWSLGVTGSYIHSSLADPSIKVGGMAPQAGQSFAMSLGAYYRSKEFSMGSKPAIFTAGASINNLGTKMQYFNSSTVIARFIASNLRIGTGFKLGIDKYNSVGFYLDVNKLLVPTPNPDIYIKDSNGKDSILQHKGVNVNTLDPFSGMVSSLFDAPGGVSEKINEFTTSFGFEYWYGAPKILALRAGYFGESETKGGRKYFTTGFGIRYDEFSFDFSYLIPVSSNSNPLQNTLRLSLTYNITGNYVNTPMTSSAPAASKGGKSTKSKDTKAVKSKDTKPTKSKDTKPKKVKK